MNIRGSAQFSARVHGFVASVALCLILTMGTHSQAADWAGFRGNVHGVSAETGVFPTGDSISLEVAWKTKIGIGYSGIAVAGGKLLTAYVDGESDILACHDAGTGKQLWKFDLGPTYKGHDGSHGGPIATPLINGDRVYMLSALGRLVAVSLAKGELVWSTDFVADHQAKAPFYGFGASPLIVDGVLVMEVGGPSAMVMGFNPADGKKMWAAGDDGVAYQSPVVFESSEGRLVLASGSKKLVALKPADGTVVGTYEYKDVGPHGAGSCVPVPVGANRAFVQTGDEGSSLVEWKSGGAEPTFDAVWTGKSIRNTYNVPVFHKNHLYGYTSRFLTCVDAAKGETVWKSRLPGDGFVSLVDGHLIVATKAGSIHIVPATPEGMQEKVSLPVFDEVVWAHPSFADGRIYQRSVGELACINVVRGKAPTVVAGGVEGQMPDTKFGQFVAGLAGEKDKKSAIDKFMGDQKTFPIAENDRAVHFVYRGSGNDLALGGDMFGARQERPMHRVDGTDLFYFSIPVEADARMNYVFMRDYETITDPRNSRETTSLLVDEEMEMSFDETTTKMSWFAMPKWSEPAYLRTEANTAEGGKMETHELDSAALGKKHKIEVYLPAGYTGSDKRFSTAYVFGGSAALKYGHWRETLDQLCGKNVEPLIAVFIDEASFKQQDKFLKMFAEELIPFVDKTYRTVATAEGRAAIGAGFAGADAWLCALKNPELVSKVGGQSLFLFDAFSPDIKGAIAAANSTKMFFYLDWGKYDFRNPHEAWDMGKVNRGVAEALKNKGFPMAGGEVNDSSDWSSWRNRTDRLLTALYAKKSG